MSVLSAYMFAYCVHAWCPWSSEKDISSSGTGVRSGFKSPSGCWELNPGSFARVLKAQNH